MTNILLLPQIQATFRVIDNAGWYDAIAFKLAGGANALDISGIRFKGSMRASPEASHILLKLDTENNTLVNEGASGILQWNIQPEMLRGNKTGTYAFDLLAIADDKTINLFQKAGPAKVILKKGVTR